MSGPEEAPDEFSQIAELFRPLTRGAPGALGLLDDAAVIPSRPGWDLVVTKDAMVCGVHFRPDEDPEQIAQRLMRANLSDLAAKAAEPFGYFLMTAWSGDFGWEKRQAFAHGLARDGELFNVSLLGGDTVATPGPLTLSMTALGWVPAGQMVRRDSAQIGDLVVVSGPIGDGWLDWGLGQGPHIPVPRLDLREKLRGFATSSADISDGLIADAGHLAKASGHGMRLDLARMPLSPQGFAWTEAQPDAALARLRLATAGDDYQLVCTVGPADAGRLGLTIIGEVTEEGFEVLVEDRRMEAGSGGWTHS
ncbi:MAG: thiamine-phosphate kinase [Alphaproteobacteria bacterium PA2]|nr:MAG: thiamine-phosphate kinase [Alphaproteobacteria bacterium PA2]